MDNISTYATKDGLMCDQIFIGKVPKQGEAFTYKMVSTGKGRTTCGAFLKMVNIYLCIYSFRR
jgi:hypothetical protein